MNPFEKFVGTQQGHFSDIYRGIYSSRTHSVFSIIPHAGAGNLLAIFTLEAF
jgi:hypothetical protein